MRSPCIGLGLGSNQEELGISRKVFDEHYIFFFAGSQVSFQPRCSEEEQLWPYRCGWQCWALEEQWPREEGLYLTPIPLEVSTKNIKSTSIMGIIFPKINSNLVLMCGKSYGCDCVFFNFFRTFWVKKRINICKSQWLPNACWPSLGTSHVQQPLMPSSSATIASSERTKRKMGTGKRLL